MNDAQTRRFWPRTQPGQFPSFVPLARVTPVIEQLDGLLFDLVLVSQVPGAIRHAIERYRGLLNSSPCNSHAIFAHMHNGIHGPDHVI